MAARPRSVPVQATAAFAAAATGAGQGSHASMAHAAAAAGGGGNGSFPGAASGDSGGGSPPPLAAVSSVPELPLALSPQPSLRLDQALNGRQHRSEQQPARVRWSEKWGTPEAIPAAAAAAAAAAPDWLAAPADGTPGASRVGLLFSSPQSSMRSVRLQAWGRGSFPGAVSPASGPRTGLATAASAELAGAGPARRRAAAGQLQGAEAGLCSPLQLPTAAGSPALSSPSFLFGPAERRGQQEQQQQEEEEQQHEQEPLPLLLLPKQHPGPGLPEACEQPQQPRLARQASGGSVYTSADSTAGMDATSALVAARDGQGPTDVAATQAAAAAVGSQGPSDVAGAQDSPHAWSEAGPSAALAGSLPAVSRRLALSPLPPAASALPLVAASYELQATVPGGWVPTACHCAPPRDPSGPCIPLTGLESCPVLVHAERGQL
jgi:hypothetical protein